VSGPVFLGAQPVEDQTVVSVVARTGILIMAMAFPV
jgi:hypothetical protein